MQIKRGRCLEAFLFREHYAMASRLLKLTLFCFLFQYAFAEAQTICSSVISYSIQKEDKSQPEPVEIFFGEIKAQGPDEAVTKTKLESEIHKAKNRAREHCRSQHENTAGCMQGKLATSAGALQTASFTARKALEEALLSDCKKQQGICKDVKSSEIKCILAEPTVAADAKAEGGKAAEGGKKDEKKK